MKTTRKDELIDELKQIQGKQIEKTVNELKPDPPKSNRAHDTVMYFDLLIKFCVAVAVSASFLYIVYTGNVEAMEGAKGFSVGAGAGNFQLLSVVGPLFGMVMSYYFGKSKASANGE